MAKTKTKPTKTKESKPDKGKKGLKPAEIRFVHLYLGGEDGKCWNNATRSYIIAFEIDTPLVKVKIPIEGKKGDESRYKEDYTTEYKSAKTLAWRLLTKVDIIAYKDKLLLEMGYTAENIKKRFSELAFQNKHIPIAHAATRDMAKIAGVMTDDKKVDIPQLEELGEAIKSILTPESKKKKLE